MAIIGAISSSHPGTIEYTGSFAKILCVSQSTNTGNVMFDKIVFGKKSDPFQGIASATSFISKSEYPTGTYIDGPIQSFKLVTDGGHVLAYYSDLY